MPLIKLHIIFVIMYVFRNTENVNGLSRSFDNKPPAETMQHAIHKVARSKRSVEQKYKELMLDVLDKRTKENGEKITGLETKIQNLEVSQRKVTETLEKVLTSMNEGEQRWHNKFDSLESQITSHIRRLDKWLGEVKWWFETMRHKKKQMYSNDHTMVNTAHETEKRNFSEEITQESSRPKDTDGKAKHLAMPCSSEREGETCNILRDCSDVSEFKNETGIFTIYVGNKTTPVFCETDNNSLQWTVIQRRINGSVDFANRTYSEYANGFGNLMGEFWIGNDNLHLITSSGNYSLRIDLETFDGSKWHALYKTFSMGSSSQGYKLKISGYSGTAKDALNGLFSSDGALFSAVDQDNDSSPRSACATTSRRGGWWYGRQCGMANLNGVYYHNTFTRNCTGLVWFTLRMSCESMKFSEMKIKRNVP